MSTARGGGGRWRTRLRLVLAALVAAVAPVVLAVPALAAVNVSPFDPAGPNAARINELYTVIFWLAVAVTVVVGGLILFAALRFRRRDENEPSQFHSNTALEITWTAVPFVILAVIFVLTAQNMGFIRNGPAEGMTVKVIGQQFAWQFEYPGTGVKVGTTLYVPAGEDIRLEIVSTDVNHSWWIPRLAGKTDAIPGQTNHAWFRADTPGTYDGQCTEFCGLGHALMVAKVVALPRPEFDRWLQQQIQQRRTTPTVSPSPAPTRTASPSPSR